MRSIQAIKKKIFKIKYKIIKEAFKIFFSHYVQQRFCEKNKNRCWEYNPEIFYHSSGGITTIYQVFTGKRESFIFLHFFFKKSIENFFKYY